jgi:hypothetical protein
VTAFGRRSERIRLQVLLEFHIGQDVFKAVFLISPQLNNEVIWGCNFLKEYGMQLCFDTGRLEYVYNGQTRSHQFDVLGTLSNKEVAGVAAAEHCQSNTVREIRKEVWADLVETSFRQISRSNNELVQHTNHEQWNRNEQEMHSKIHSDNPTPTKPTGIDPRNLNKTI